MTPEEMLAAITEIAEGSKQIWPRATLDAKYAAVMDAVKKRDEAEMKMIWPSVLPADTVDAATGRAHESPVEVTGNLQMPNS
jgi:hypothetical protein